MKCGFQIRNVLLFNCVKTPQTRTFYSFVDMQRSMGSLRRCWLCRISPNFPLVPVSTIQRRAITLGATPVAGTMAWRFGAAGLWLSMNVRNVLPTYSSSRRGLTSSAGEALLPRSADAIASTLCGLQDSTSDDPPVVDFLDIITEQIIKCVELFRPEHVYASLLGLQGMKSDNEKVLRLLSALADKIQACEGPWDLGDICDAFFGLQNLSSDHADVRRLLRVLGAQLASASGDGTATGFSDLMFGLQGMSSDHEEVIKILDIVALKLQRCKEQFTIDDIAFFVHGMQRMKSTSPEVRALLADLATRLRAVGENEMVDFETLSAFLVGMQDMSTDAAEVRDILCGVTSRYLLVEAVPVAELTATLSCMRGMKTKHKETCLLLSKLLDVFEASQEPLSADDIILCLRSLQSMESSEPTVRRYLALLKERIFNSQEPVDTAQLNAVMKACLTGLDMRHQEALSLMSLLYYKLQGAVTAPAT